VARPASVEAVLHGTDRTELEAAQPGPSLGHWDHGNGLPACVWGTAVYFVAEAVLALRSRVSSIAAVVPPSITITPETTGSPADLRRMIQQAGADAPGWTLAAVYLPGDAEDLLVISMGQSGRCNLSHVSQLYFDPYTVGCWRSGDTAQIEPW
jgi:hypothetical protein